MSRRARPLLTACAMALLAAACAVTPIEQNAQRAAASAESAAPIYRDASAPISARVEDLLARMTPEEKVAQLLTAPGPREFDLEKLQHDYPNGMGDFTRPGDFMGPPTGDTPPPMRSAVDSIALMINIQRWAVEHTRLGIPVIYHEEGLHGATINGAASFPQSIAMGSSWDPELVRRVNAVIARELRARGVTASLSPVVDIARDPRWGRIEETFGEDPYLVGEMAVAAVRGLQGDALPLGDDRVFATLKHFTGHGQPESGTNVGPALLGERTIREMFFPPFEQVMQRTNIRRVMASYNEIDGIPSHANRWLLTDVLRDEWHFKGAVVGDYFAVRELMQKHHLAGSLPEVAAMALHAGVDVDEPDGEGFQHLLEALNDGRISMDEIDTAVRRVLEIKFQAGLFEHPYTDIADLAVIDNDEARALAVEAALRTTTLLKNEGDVLPFDLSNVRTLAVIGSNAEQAHIGNYSGRPRHTVSLLDGVRAYVGDRARVVYSEGVRVTAQDGRPFVNEVTLADPAENARRIRAAVAVARRADHIILALGDPELTSREAWLGHLGDRDSIDLLGQQYDLLNAILALHKPTVVVLINGKPPSYPHLAESAPAILEAWYAGQEQGTALAQILFGDANPGGHLPFTVARSVGQLPIYYNQKPTAHRGYLFSTTEPLYPFGFGLSYTTFDISEPRLSASTIQAGASVQVSVDVRNTGDRAGDEVVQLYIRDQFSSVTRPVKELKGFQRVTLQPGESRTLTFTLDAHAFEFYNAAMRRVIEPGDFDIMVGDNSRDVKTTVLTIAN